jgi:hypothetical protein
MFGSWVIVAAIVVVIVAGALDVLPGLLLGGRSGEVRTTTGLVSVFRFASLGLIIIGAQLHADPVYLGPALTFALVDFILPLPWPWSSATAPGDGTSAPARPLLRPPPLPRPPGKCRTNREKTSESGSQRSADQTLQFCVGDARSIPGP